jgi:hypothetical protein
VSGLKPDVELVALPRSSLGLQAQTSCSLKDEFYNLQHPCCPHLFLLFQEEEREDSMCCRLKPRR